MNSMKHIRKLYRELKNSFAETEQEDIAFFIVEETDDTYTWHFKLGTTPR